VHNLLKKEHGEKYTAYIKKNDAISNNYI